MLEASVLLCGAAIVISVPRGVSGSGSSSLEDLANWPRFWEREQIKKVQCESCSGCKNQLHQISAVSGGKKEISSTFALLAINCGSKWPPSESVSVAKEGLKSQEELIFRKKSISTNLAVFGWREKSGKKSIFEQSEPQRVSSRRRQIYPRDLNLVQVPSRRSQWSRIQSSLAAWLRKSDKSDILKKKKNKKSSADRSSCIQSVWFCVSAFRSR